MVRGLKVIEPSSIKSFPKQGHITSRVCTVKHNVPGYLVQTVLIPHLEKLDCFGVLTSYYEALIDKAMPIKSLFLDILPKLQIKIVLLKTQILVKKATGCSEK